MINDIVKIALIGPESSGKSELCQYLAHYYQTEWVEEYSRAYLSNLNRKYTMDDIIKIYKTQFEMEQIQMEKANAIMFIDTEFINAQVWCEEVFGACPEFISTMVGKQNYHLYLLTAPDLPWRDDPLRENPGKGEYFFDRYKKILEHKQFQYSIIEGEEETRLKNAVAAVDRFLHSNKN